MIKKWQQFLNESTLIGRDISEEINEIKDFILNNKDINTDDLLSKLREIFNRIDICFTTVSRAVDIFPINKDTLESLNKDEHGILLGFISTGSKIFIIIDADKYLSNLKEKTDDTLFTTKTILNHELVHRRQYEKMGDKIHQHFKKHKNYLSNPRELMAFAKNIADSLERSFNNDKYVINNMLRYGAVASSIQRNIKDNVTQDEYRKLLKHVYNYINL